MKFEPFEIDSKHSNGNANHSKGIRSILIQILMQILIQSIQMEMLTTRKVFEAF